MASPENDIRWAEGADASDLSFPSVEQESGYGVGEDYPAAQINQYRRDMARWVSRGFATLGEFINVVPPGGVGVVNSFDPTRQFGGVVDAGVALDLECHAIDTDGRFVFTLEGDPLAPNRIVRVYDREDLSAVLASITPQRGLNDNNEYLELVANGGWVAVAINDSATTDPLDGYVELFAFDSVALTLTRQWLWSDGSGFEIRVTDIAMDHEAVYIAHDGVSAVDGGAGYRVLFTAGTGGASITNGSEDWISAHGAVLNAVDTNGFHVVFGGFDDGSAAWRLTDIDGTAIDAGGSNTINPRQIALIHDKWYRVEDDAGAHVFVVRGFGIAGLGAQEAFLRGQGLSDRLVVGAAPNLSLHVDGRYLLTQFAAGEAQIVDIETGIVLTRNAFALTKVAAALDGDAFFFGGTGGSAQIFRLSRNTPVRYWRRVSVTDQILPLRQLAIPEI